MRPIHLLLTPCCLEYPMRPYSPELHPEDRDTALTLPLHITDPPTLSPCRDALALFHPASMIVFIPPLHSTIKTAVVCYCSSRFPNPTRHLYTLSSTLAHHSHHTQLLCPIFHLSWTTHPSLSNLSTSHLSHNSFTSITVVPTSHHPGHLSRVLPARLQ
jgi:hypothetical protein